MIAFVCTGCSRTLRVDDSLSGKKGRCPACRGTTLIPSLPSAAAAGDAATLPPTVTESATLPPTGPEESATLPPSGSPDSAATLAPVVSRPATGDARAPAGYAIDKELGRGGM